MKYLSIIFLSLSTYIPAIEYSSLHDQTYWYYDDEIADIMNYTLNTWGNKYDKIIDEKYVKSLKK